jgi:probable biosynthetic protein (TIGR04098 family)
MEPLMGAVGNGEWAGGTAAPRVPFSRCDLLLDPRHTGVNNLSEFLFLMQLGALQWEQISRFAGIRMRDFRSGSGDPIYASFYYIRESFSPERPLSSYALDDLLTILSRVCLCGSTVVDGEHLLYREDAYDPGSSPPSVRMSNVFVQKQSGPDHLKVTLPANVDLDRFPRVPLMPDTYELTRRVKQEEVFSRRQPGLRPFGPQKFSFHYEINPDRDINGVGLVYFANYVAFLDMAERALLRCTKISEDQIDQRSLVEREIAYFGNARSTDVLHIGVEAHWMISQRAKNPLVQFDYRVRRESDGRLICVSQSRKILPMP